MRLRVATVQPAPVTGGLEDHLRHVDDRARAVAQTSRPDLIVLPDISGPHARPVDGAPFVLLRELAREYGCVVAGGALLVRGGDVCSTYLVIEPDGRAHLHDCDTGSTRHRAGDDDGITAVHAWGGRRVGLVSGPEWARPSTARRLRDARVELIIGTGGSDHHAVLVARHTGAPVVRPSAASDAGHAGAVVELGSRPVVPPTPAVGRARRGTPAAYWARRALRRFPWQHVPSTDVPDELGPRRAHRPRRPLTIPVVVEALRTVADDTVGLTLRAQDGTPLPTWTPGAHIDVILDETTTRQYSLCGEPTDATYEIAVLREPDGRGGSVRICDTVRPGDGLTIRGPRNHFRWTPGRPTLFLAGGIGITPILPMVREAAATGADWRLLYTARTAGRMAFRDEVLALSGDRVHLRSDDVDGLLDVGDVISHAPGGTQVYACGPAGLLASLEEACDRHGVRLYVERFTAPVTEAAEDRAFTLVAARSGLTVPVPAYDTALAAVRRAGVAVDTACENGVCGSCQVRVLDGCPDQRDTITTRRGAETDHVMMLCVSRARTASITVDI